MLITRQLDIMKLYNIILFISTVAVAWICRIWYKNYIKCSTSFIHRTCEEYKKSGTLHNSLCHTICIENDFAIENCIGSTTFNKSVFAVIINGHKTILKVNMQWFDHVSNARAEPLTIFNATSYFNDIVSTYFGSNRPNSNKLTQKLIIMADSDKNGSTSSLEAIWFGSLLSTQETFMLAALNESKSTVNFNRYCGALYEVEKVHISSSHLVDTSKAFTDFWALPEFAEPVESLFKDIFGELRDDYRWFEALHEYIYIFIKRLRRDKVPNFEQRLQFILGTLEMLHSLASFEYGEITWCDVLYENLGFTNMNNFSSVKLADLDEVFFVRKVFENIGNSEKTCSRNTDCLGENYDVGEYYHLECSPYCQHDGHCSQRPLKSNLAYLCKSLLFDVMFNPVVMALSEQVIFERVASMVYSILKDCGKSVEYNNTDEYLSHIRAVSASFVMVKTIFDASD